MIAHLGDSSLLVFDLVHRKVLRIIRGIPSVHGVTLDPKTGRIFATATGSDRLFEIRMATGKTLRTYPAGHHPDGLAFDPVHNRVFVSDETGDAVTEIDLSQGSIRTLSLPGEVGNTRYNKTNNTVFSPVSEKGTEKKGMIAEIDPESLSVTGTIPVPDDCHPHGERVSPDGSEIDILCQKTATLLIVDRSHKTIRQSFPVGVDPDVLSVDVKRGHMVVASESGVVSVFHRTAGIWKKMGDMYVSYRAHTVVIDPGTGLVYLPLEDVHGKPVLRIMKIR